MAIVYAPIRCAGFRKLGFSCLMRLDARFSKDYRRPKVLMSLLDESKPLPPLPVIEGAIKGSVVAACLLAFVLTSMYTVFDGLGEYPLPLSPNPVDAAPSDNASPSTTCTPAADLRHTNILPRPYPTSSLSPPPTPPLPLSPSHSHSPLPLPLPSPSPFPPLSDPRHTHIRPYMMGSIGHSGYDIMKELRSRLHFETLISNCARSYNATYDGNQTVARPLCTAENSTYFPFRYVGGEGGGVGGREEGAWEGERRLLDPVYSEQGLMYSRIHTTYTTPYIHLTYATATPQTRPTMCTASG
jgi:hypothetical protein